VSSFDTLDHGWLVKFIEHRVADRRVVRLIQKWLKAGAPTDRSSSVGWKAGVLEEGKRIQSEVGTVQGGSISPLLSNIYLHYVLDLWVQQWRQKQARGEVIFVRFADGTPVQISNLRGASPLIPIVRSGI
jgi:retron-type reverse transcriptase